MDFRELFYAALSASIHTTYRRRIIVTLEDGPYILQQDWTLTKITPIPASETKANAFAF